MQARLDSLLADVERIIIKAIMQQNVASTKQDSSYLNDSFNDHSDFGSNKLY